MLKWKVVSLLEVVIYTSQPPTPIRNIAANMETISARDIDKFLWKFFSSCEYFISGKMKSSMWIFYEKQEM